MMLCCSRLEGKKDTTATKYQKHSSKMSAEPLKLNPSSTAIVLIEFQNEFTTEGGALHDAVKDCMAATDTLKNSKKLMDDARESGAKIIHLPIMYEPVSQSI
jgi:hypothetical protein